MFNTVYECLVKVCTVLGDTATSASWAITGHFLSEAITAVHGLVQTRVSRELLKIIYPAATCGLDGALCLLGVSRETSELVSKNGRISGRSPRPDSHARGHFLYCSNAHNIDLFEAVDTDILRSMNVSVRTTTRWKEPGTDILRFLCERRCALRRCKSHDRLRQGLPACERLARELTPLVLVFSLLRLPKMLLATTMGKLLRRLNNNCRRELTVRSTKRSRPSLGRPSAATGCCSDGCTICSRL